MRRNSKSFFVSVVILVGLLVSFISPTPTVARAPEPPNPKQAVNPTAQLGAAPAGIENITGSTVQDVDPDLLPIAAPFDICFTVFETTNDAEYLDRFDFDLPDAWTVNTVYDVPGNGCGLGHTFGVEAGNVVNWTTNGMPSGCGDWLPGTYDFCANITVPDSGGAPWSVPWNIIGDTYGVPPHSVSGAVDLFALEPGIFLTPAVMDVSGCNGATNTYTFSLFNYSGADGTFDLTYSVPTANGTLTGPASLIVDDNETVSFEVTLTSGLCTEPPDIVTGMIDAAGNGYTASSTINYTVVSAPGWEAIPGSAPSWAGMGYPRDGCTAFDVNGDTVTYLFGDTTSIFGFWAYNHNTNTWFQPAPTDLPPDRWAPDWAYDPDTNLCYVTGGANTPGGGTYNTAYVFDPVANAFTDIGPFTSIRDFHTSWIGTLGGTKYLCIGGGVNASSIIQTSTQCYDIEAGVWNAENAQMDPLPTDPFGAADGVLHAAGGDQFWYVGGAINNFATVTDEARYWDDADGAWHLAGTTGKAAYRVEGDFLDGEFYFVNGSSGGFTPTNTGKKGTFDGTNWVWTDLPLTNNLRMDNIVNAFEGTVWSVDGYGTSNSGYVEKLASCPLCEGVVVDIPPLDVELCQDATEVIVGTLTNTGAVDVTFSVTETLDFLGVEPITGTILPGGSTVLTFTFDTTGLAPGLYTGDVTIMTDDPVTGDIVLPVSLLVNQNTEILDVAYDVNFLDVSFEAMITGTEPLETFWDFGDGITQTGGLTATHTYAAGGCYNVMFEVSGPCGVETLEFEVCVCEPFGGADFTWMPDPAIAGEDTLFEATVISGTAPFEFTWDFGDGITPTVGGITTTHAFAAAGDYTVTLTVADACESIIVEHLVTVLPPPCEPPAGVDFMWTPEEPLTGEAVVFEGTVMTGTEPFTFDWLITDAFTPTPDITGTGQTFTYTFDAAGVYTITLTVTNECGTETATATITVMAPVFKAYLPVILRATVP